MVSKSLVENATISHLMRLVESKPQLKVFAAMFFRAHFKPNFFEPITKTFSNINKRHLKIQHQLENPNSKSKDQLNPQKIPHQLKSIKFHFTPDITVRNADWSKSER